MKPLIILILALGIIISCNSENELTETLVHVIELPNGDEISVPEGYSLVDLQGIDSAFGRIISDSNPDFQLLYDIGLLAGEYVDVDLDKETENSINEKFWYQTVDKKYISDPDCCVYITFPDVGPANFITLNNADLDLILAIMKTYERID